ncbi:MAG: NAD+ synthase [Deltaproteobacteria bacterium]|nr:NAD+ synthase [Deltaproteobacteria bacterium]
MLRLFLCQMNPTVGDIPGNAAKILDGLRKARHWGAEIAVFPECALVGYPPEDLLFKAQFVRENLKALEEIREHTRGLTAVVGFVHREDDLYNAAAVLHDGELRGVVKKAFLPNYGVFDEDRYFQAGRETPVFRVGGRTFGVTICEDMWYPGGPARTQALQGGAELLLNISASPYYAGKAKFRETMLATRAADNACLLAFCNLVGGQDELVFDGNSLVFSPRGEVLARGLPFEEDTVVVDVDPAEVFNQRLRDPRRRVALRAETPALPLSEIVHLAEPPRAPKGPLPIRAVEGPGEEEEVYRALALGCRDYVRKNQFEKVLLGLSGGIDSALTASIAVDALGLDHVLGITMPSPYSSEGSVTDSLELARNLGIECRTVPIAPVFDAFLGTLAPLFDGAPVGVAEENLQARIRGSILMALSNKFGWLLLSTGNKSETSVGYCTLYGDMAGGFDVLKDVPKTLVFRLAQWRNAAARRPWIPEATLTKEPSAELRPDQRDTDSLPAYELLDPILEGYVEVDRSFESLAAEFGVEVVSRVVALVDRNEYKRRQAPPGVKITPRAFGKDRRFPITNRWRESR